MIVFVMACAGPQPRIEGARVGPSPVPGHVRVGGTLINDGGEGTVEIDLALHGAARLQADETIDVPAHTTIDLAIDVAAPPGEYTVDAVAKYPN
ncbi:MAG: hypothetical protein QM831_33285 [Kofleriaceae bacterium]